jgi:hypothetical protein
MEAVCGCCMACATLSCPLLRSHSLHAPSPLSATITQAPPLLLACTGGCLACSTQPSTLSRAALTGSCERCWARATRQTYCPTWPPAQTRRSRSAALSLAPQLAGPGAACLQLIEPQRPGSFCSCPAPLLLKTSSFPLARCPLLTHYPLLSSPSPCRSCVVPSPTSARLAPTGWLPTPPLPSAWWRCRTSSGARWRTHSGATGEEPGQGGGGKLVCVSVLRGKAERQESREGRFPAWTYAMRG